WRASTTPNVSNPGEEAQGPVSTSIAGAMCAPSLTTFSRGWPALPPRPQPQAHVRSPLVFEPHNRALLTKMLQPPRGYSLSRAVGTTFTIDLATALNVPLSFAAHHQDDADDVGIIAAL